jgi:hypothetical protein
LWIHSVLAVLSDKNNGINYWVCVISLCSCFIKWQKQWITWIDLSRIHSVLAVLSDKNNELNELIYAEFTQFLLYWVTKTMKWMIECVWIHSVLAVLSDKNNEINELIFVNSLCSCCIKWQKQWKNWLSLCEFTLFLLY